MSLSFYNIMSYIFQSILDTTRLTCKSASYFLFYGTIYGLQFVSTNRGGECMYFVTIEYIVKVRTIVLDGDNTLRR